MFDYLSMVTGADLPIPELQVVLHQPTIKEIGIIGETSFYNSLSLFNVDKDKILKSYDEKIIDEVERTQAKSRLSGKANFDIIMEMVQSNPSSKYSIETILLLVLPEFTFAIKDRFILANSATMEQPLLIHSGNFDYLKNAIMEIFCITSAGKLDDSDYQPGNKAAEEIAAKLRRGREKAKELNGNNSNSTSILGTYVSRLGIGSNSLNILDIQELTVFQLIDQMKVFGLWTQHEYNIKIALAGAKDVEQVDWLKSF